MYSKIDIYDDNYGDFEGVLVVDAEELNLHDATYVFTSNNDYDMYEERHTGNYYAIHNRED